MEIQVLKILLQNTKNIHSRLLLYKHVCLYANMLSAMMMIMAYFRNCKQAPIKCFPLQEKKIHSKKAKLEPIICDSLEVWAIVPTGTKIFLIFPFHIDHV